MKAAAALLLAAAGFAAALLQPSAGEARDNRPLKCNIGAARRAPSAGGPALVANVARAMTPVDLNAVQMNDKGIWKKVVVEGLFARRTEAETLEVMARLINCTKEPLVVQARSTFLDAGQYPTEPVSAWKTVHISPRSMATYEERSIGARKVDTYLIELRSDQ